MRKSLDVVVYADVSVPYLAPDVRHAVTELFGAGWSAAEFRSGCRLATAAVRGEVVGAAWALRAPQAAAVPLSPGLRALGPDRYAEWLAGGLELTGLAVGSRHRGGGVGAVLAQAVLTAAIRRRGWAQTTGCGLTGVGSWLRRRGWVPVAADRDGAGEVLLDPRHPAVCRYAGATWSVPGPPNRPR